MNPNDQAWLENRVHAAVDDDFYLDRDEEKRIKEEAASRGIANRDTELAVRSTLEAMGAVCERVLVDELDRLLHQFTDDDKRLDAKEERDAMDKVLRPASGKKAGLDPRVAEDYANSFCKVNGIRRDSQGRRWAVPGAAVAVLAVAIAGTGLWWSQRAAPAGLQSASAGTSAVLLGDKDRAEIDDQLRRASAFVEKSQFTDPPERCAKSSLDQIHQMDPGRQYRGDEVKALVNRIVGHYLALADKSYAAKDSAGVTRWLERAKLMGAEMETIRDKERALGVIKKEQ